MSYRALLLVTLSSALAACSEETPTTPGAFLWEVQLTGTEDTCHTEVSAYDETLTYGVLFEGSGADLFIDATQFATGTVSGCDLFYESPVYGEERGDSGQYWVRWQISGNAVQRQGGSSCDLPVELDWQGTEVMNILSSDDPDLLEGCSYTTTVEGTFQGQSE